MASNRNAFEKRAREKAKHERAAAKRERRQQRADGESGSDELTVESDQESVLAELAALHQSFEDGAVNFEDFEARRAELLERLQVD